MNRKDFSQTQINNVWSKRCGSATSCRDVKGRTMHKSAYGNRNSTYGWEIDHKTPVSKGGSDSPSNLQPLHWKSNAEKGNK